MKDLLSAFWTSFGSSIYAWSWPSLLFVGFSWVAYAGNLDGIAVVERATGAPILNQGLVIVGLSLFLGAVLMTLSTPLTRTLEGYYLPKKIRELMIRREVTRWERTWKRISDADPAEHRVGWVRDQERLNRFPREEERIMPTRLGNALRAGEDYGWVQYGISVPDLWVHLTSIADAGINDALSQSRIRVDLHIALAWLAAVSALIAVPFGVVVGAVYFLLTPALGVLAYLSYRRAVDIVSWYTRAMWALVDMSRARLAEALGIELPDQLQAEREIWMAVSDYAAWGPHWPKSPEWTEVIDAALVRRGAKAGAS